VPALLTEADVFVLPSESEAFPNAILEGMAAGLPVVAASVGGIPELVADGVSGRLVPPGDADALARALTELLDFPDRAADFGRAGRRRIEETYSFDRMVGQFETLYVSELERLGRAGRRLRSDPQTPRGAASASVVRTAPR
jgi:glycosyltransferase involved in cell wall biosynthesis